METVNNKWALIVRGIFLIGIGILLFTISQNSTKNLVLLFSLLTFLAGIAGFEFATANKTNQLKSNWLMLESGADISFSIVAIFFYLKSADLTVDFLTAFASFALLFAFLQVIYIFQLAQIGLIPNIKIIVVRLILSWVFGLFGIILLFKSSFPGVTTSLINFIGIGPLLAGVSLLILSSKMYIINKNPKIN